MTKPDVRFLVALFAVALLATPALARPPHRGGEPPAGRFLERHAEELGIDADTKLQISQISEASRGANRQLREQLHAAHDALRELLAADPIDDAAVIEQATRIGELETEKRIGRLRAVIEIQRLLTPEQRAQLAEIRKSRPGPGSRHGPRGKAMRKACREDRQRLCADADRGPARHHCLMDHRDALSAACRDALDAGPVGPAGPRGVDPGPGEPL